LAVQFRLIGVDLLLLICLSLLLALKLIADQQAGAEPKRTADGGTHSRMTHSCSDNTSNSGAAKGTDASILLATDRHKHKKNKSNCSSLLHESSFVRFASRIRRKF
jgi:hypothetical protein